MSCYCLLLPIVQTETTSGISRQAVCPGGRLSRRCKMDTQNWRLGRNIDPSTPGRKNCNRQFCCESNKAASPQPRDQLPSHLHPLHYQRDFRSAHDEDEWAKNGEVENTRDREHSSPMVASAVASHEAPTPQQHQLQRQATMLNEERRCRTYASHPRASTCKEQSIRFIYYYPLLHVFTCLGCSDQASVRLSDPKTPSAKQLYEETKFGNDPWL